LPSEKLYRSITKLPLYIFKECVDTGNLSNLIISGAPTDTEIRQAWKTIIQEYADAIGSNEYRLYLNIYKELTMLQITYETIKVLILILELTDDEKAVKELNWHLGTSYAFKENKQAELKICEGRNKSNKVAIDLKLIQFEEIEKKHKAGQGSKLSSAYIDSVLITLSDHSKYNVDDRITVFSFCERIKRLNTYRETMQNKK